MDCRGEFSISMENNFCACRLNLAWSSYVAGQQIRACRLPAIFWGIEIARFTLCRLFALSCIVVILQGCQCQCNINVPKEVRFTWTAVVSFWPASRVELVDFQQFVRNRNCKNHTLGIVVTLARSEWRSVLCHYVFWLYYVGANVNVKISNVQQQEVRFTWTAMENQHGHQFLRNWNCKIHTL